MKNNTTPVYKVVKCQTGKFLMLLTLGFFLMSLNPALASIASPGQQQTVTGKVTDSFTGKAIAGVTITVKGTKTVVKTDKDGAYSIVLPKNAKILVFTLIGYQQLEVAIAGRASIIVEMSIIEIDPSLW
jgi:hypothetical protein